MVRKKVTKKRISTRNLEVRTDVALIVMKEYRVLLGEKRKTHHEESVWDLPGGRRKDYETFKECGLRETYEETGLRVKLIDDHPWAETENYFATGKKEDTLIYRAEPINDNEPKTKEKDKFHQWAYFPWDKLPNNISLCLKNLKKQGYDPFKK